MNLLPYIFFCLPFKFFVHYFQYISGHFLLWKFSRNHLTTKVSKGQSQAIFFSNYLKRQYVNLNKILILQIHVYAKLLNKFGGYYPDSNIYIFKFLKSFQYLCWSSKWNKNLYRYIFRHKYPQKTNPNKTDKTWKHFVIFIFYKYTFTTLCIHTSFTNQ